jgi:RNA polymerase primary sigma factor
VGSKKPERSTKKSAAIVPKKAPAPEKPKPTKATAQAKSKSSAPPSSAPPSSEQDEDFDEDDLPSSPAASNGKPNGKTKEQLISLGKSKGFLTYDDVHEALPGEEVGPDQMDDVLSALDDEEIEVVDDASNIKIAPHRVSDEDGAPSKAQAKTEDDTAAEGSGPASGTPGRANDDEYYKSNDPVRMYLRKMGSVALLTREGEVEIAKRIEEGENEVLTAILSSPIAVREIIDIGERLRNHKIRVKDIVRDAEDEEHEFDEEEADRRIIRLIDRVRRLDKKNAEVVEERKTAVDARKKLID